MPTTADELRRLTTERVLALTPTERIDMAFALGEADLRLFAEMNGLTREVAVCRLRATRQIGRCRSVMSSLAMGA